MLARPFVCVPPPQMWNLLTLLPSSNTIVLVIFEKLLRFQLSSDRRQIFATDCTAHTVHCPKIFFENFKQFSYYKGISIGKLKMCKTAIFELIFFL
jgi:hypothetical protein